MSRYEAMLALRGAQLIDGQVLMPSPVPAEGHAAPCALITGWLGHYSIHRPDLMVYPGVTLILDNRNVVEPDVILCSEPKTGGRVWLDEEGYLRGSPELVCEIALSAASIDLHDKFRLYRRHAVQEYLVWITGEKQLRWFHFDNGQYSVKKPDEAGFLQSSVFPGLILNAGALLRRDKAAVVAALERRPMGES